MLSYATLKIFSKVMKSYEVMPGGSPETKVLLPPPKQVTFSSLCDVS